MSVQLADGLLVFAADMSCTLRACFGVSIVLLVNVVLALPTQLVPLEPVVAHWTK